MAETVSGGGDRYEVRCAACGKPYDALSAPWCRCISKERTLVCPHCRSCFCKAARSYKEKLWDGAPQSLWDRKVAEKRRTVAPPPNPAPDAARRPLVLVVDDDTVFSSLACEAVLALGYGVVSGQDGEEGLALARAYRPDLVLSDALMPKLDGREMCRRIKEDPAMARTRTVVMTSIYKGTLQRCEAMGAFRVDDYLGKPLDAGALAAVLDRLIGDRQGP